MRNHQSALLLPAECKNMKETWRSSNLYFVPATWWLAHSLTPLPGHEGLQHSHALFGEIVLSDHMLQGLEVAGNHNHRLHLVLALSNRGGGSERASIAFTNQSRYQRHDLRMKCTLISPSKTNKDETKLYPWKEGVANAFLRRVSVKRTKQTTYIPTLNTQKITVCIVFMHILKGSSEAMEGKKSKSVWINKHVCDHTLLQ